MAEVSVQDVGGTLMVEVPTEWVEELNLVPGAKLQVSLRHGGLEVRPRRRPKYRLADLISNSDPRAFEQTEEDREWHRSGPVGRELL